MRAVRVQPTSVDHVLIDVSCDCGRVGPLRNKRTGENEFKTPLLVGQFGNEETLVCDCGREFLLQPQTSHFHVFDMGEPDKQ